MIDAGAHAALAGEWELIDSIRSLTPGATYYHPGLWPLLTGQSPASGEVKDDLDQAWNDLVVAEQAGDTERIEALLQYIVEWWWEEIEDDYSTSTPTAILIMTPRSVLRQPLPSAMDTFHGISPRMSGGIWRRAWPMATPNRSTPGTPFHS